MTKMPFLWLALWIGGGVVLVDSGKFEGLCRARKVFL